MNSLYRGGLILLVGFIFFKMGGFLFKIICMNVMPVSAYGEVAVFMVLFNWFVLFATFNVTIGLAKFISHDKGKKELYYTASLAGSLLITLVVCAALLVLAPWMSRVLNVGYPVILWAIASVPFAVIYNIGIFYFRGLYRMKSSTYADIMMTAVRIAALIGFFLAGIVYAPYIAFLLSFMAIDFYLLLKSRVRTQFKRSEVFHAFRELLIYSVPVFLSEFLRLFSTDLDRLMLSGFYSSFEAGVYDVAVSLCLGYIIIANSYSNALLPLASSSQHDGSKRRGELRRALKASTAFFILYTAIVLIAGRPVIGMINPAYMGIFSFLPALIVAYILIGFLTVLTFYANSVGYQKHAVYAGAVFAFLNLALNFYLIPRMMYWGAIYALTVSCAASLAVMALLIWKVEMCGRKVKRP